MCFRWPKEPSHRDGSFEYPQHMFWLRNKKTNLLRTLISGPDIKLYLCLMSSILVAESTSIRPDFFISWFTNHPTIIFRKVEKLNNFFNYFYILPADSKYYLFRWEKNIFLRFCLCMFESDTVKRDCPVQMFRKMTKCLWFNTDCWFTLLVLLGGVFWRY